MKKKQKDGWNSERGGHEEDRENKTGEGMETVLEVWNEGIDRARKQRKELNRHAGV